MSVEPIVNTTERMIALWKGKQYVPKKAKITCPSCGRTWIGIHRRHYTCPIRYGGCGCKFQIKEQGGKVQLKIVGQGIIMSCSECSHYAPDVGYCELKHEYHKATERQMSCL